MATAAASPQNNQSEEKSVEATQTVQSAEDYVTEATQSAEHSVADAAVATIAAHSMATEIRNQLGVHPVATT